VRKPIRELAVAAGAARAESRRGFAAGARRVSRRERNSAFRDARAQNRQSREDGPWVRCALGNARVGAYGGCRRRFRGGRSRPSGGDETRDARRRPRGRVHFESSTDRTRGAVSLAQRRYRVESLASSRGALVRTPTRRERRGVSPGPSEGIVARGFQTAGERSVGETRFDAPPGRIPAPTTRRLRFRSRRREWWFAFARRTRAHIGSARDRFHRCPGRARGWG